MFLSSDRSKFGISNDGFGIPAGSDPLLHSSLSLKAHRRFDPPTGISALKNRQTQGPDETYCFEDRHGVVAANAPQGEEALVREFCRAVGDSIAALRVSRGLSLGEVAAEAAVTLPVIRELETGAAMPGLTLDDLARVAETLGVRPAYLGRNLAGLSSAKMSPACR